MSRYERTYGNDWDFSETLFWGSLKIVGVTNRLVSNYTDEILEKRGFSLFCHEYLLVIGCKDWMERCDEKSRPCSVPLHLLSHPLKLVSQSHGGQCLLCLRWFLWSDERLAVCSQGLAITAVCRAVASETHTRL